MVTSSRSRSRRAVRVLAAGVGVVSVVWIANLVFIARNDAAKGWFDCGVHCTTTQNVAGGILFYGGLLLALLLIALLFAALIWLLRRRCKE